MLETNTPYGPATVYLGLSTTTPSQVAGTTAPYWNFTEPSGSSYARVSVSTTGNFAAASPQPANGYGSSNSNLLSFVTATGSWGTITYAGLWDSLSGGNLLIYAVLTTPTAVTSTQTVNFALTELQFNLS